MIWYILLNGEVLTEEATTALDLLKKYPGSAVSTSPISVKKSEKRVKEISSIIYNKIVKEGDKEWPPKYNA